MGQGRFAHDWGRIRRDPSELAIETAHNLISQLGIEDVIKQYGGTPPHAIDLAQHPLRRPYLNLSGFLRRLDPMGFGSAHGYEYPPDFDGEREAASAYNSLINNTFNPHEVDPAEFARLAHMMQSLYGDKRRSLRRIEEADLIDPDDIDPELYDTQGLENPYSDEMVEAENRHYQNIGRQQDALHRDLGKSFLGAISPQQRYDPLFQYTDMLPDISDLWNKLRHKPVIVSAATRRLGKNLARRQFDPFGIKIGEIEDLPLFDGGQNEIEL